MFRFEKKTNHLEVVIRPNLQRWKVFRRKGKCWPNPIKIGCNNHKILIFFDNILA